MFFLSWGRWSKIRHIGSAGIRHCDRCDQDSEFQAFVSYTVRHIYWLFRWVTGSEPQIACGNCGATCWGDEVINDATAKKAIPFFDRRGWTLGAGAIASLFGIGAIASAQDSRNSQRFIQAPIAGDLYEVDVARMSDKPEAPVMYSVVRVTGVDARAVTVQMASRYYGDLRGVQRDVRDGSTSRADYYAPGQAIIPRGAVAKMYADGVISDVVR
jgi:hypothetical protein